MADVLEVLQAFGTNLAKNEIKAIKIRTTQWPMKEVIISDPFGSPKSNDPGAAERLKPEVTIITDKGNMVIAPYGSPDDGSPIVSPTALAVGGVAGLGLFGWLAYMAGKKAR